MGLGPLEISLLCLVLVFALALIAILIYFLLRAQGASPKPLSVRHGDLSALDGDDHPAYLTVSGERAMTASLDMGNNRIIGLQPAQGSGEAVTFDQTIKPGDVAGGDLSGSYPEPQVSSINGRPVADMPPSDGDVLTWNQEAGRWEPRRPG
jgi:hypothetical protein